MGQPLPFERPPFDHPQMAKIKNISRNSRMSAIATSAFLTIFAASLGYRCWWYYWNEKPDGMFDERDLDPK
eukprot:CAMPEP_0113959664 /NCGR_PEP_ID=MMETSP0011_2-20120614/4273_1 /TAXON_ID=101924 /ORGANISM="Rhodosorus marinus" /LENGTH=70 /DNA_ID=CAMNT_0000971007 /DNA_START=166 /DNA_END=378 /DNA_ORIENTATION=+ /assembly_acc=CAM_ASM_000156